MAENREWDWLKRFRMRVKEEATMADCNAFLTSRSSCTHIIEIVNLSKNKTLASSKQFGQSVDTCLIHFVIWKCVDCHLAESAAAASNGCHSLPNFETNISRKLHFEVRWSRCQWPSEWIIHLRLLHSGNDSILISTFQHQKPHQFHRTLHRLVNVCRLLHFILYIVVAQSTMHTPNLLLQTDTDRTQLSNAPPLTYPVATML